MNTASTTASRWTVSTRTRGEVLTASVSAPALELVLLGIPPTFTADEAEGWLRDLAGVAGETSREDPRVRAIPTLLHHALTGLLFSQAELWSRPGMRGPCSVAFVDGAQGGAFGWVGEARVQVLVDGSAFEPQWVIVRDQDGREAHAAVLPGDRSTTLGIEFWPEGEDGSEAPVAIEAEWLAANTERVTVIPAAADSPAPLAHAEAPAESAAAVPPAYEREFPSLEALPSHAALPLQQPGFASPPVTLDDAGEPQANATHVRRAPEPNEYEAMLAALAASVPPALEEPVSGAAIAEPGAPGPGMVAELPVREPGEREAFETIVPKVTIRSSGIATDLAAAPAPGAIEEAEPPVAISPAMPGSAAIEEPAAPASESAPASAVASEPGTQGGGTMLVDDLPAEPASAAGNGEYAEPPAQRAQHPVGRWLGKLLGFGRRKPVAPEPVPEDAPVSAYDSLLSSSVPPSEVVPAEQTVLELPPIDPPRLEEPDAPDFARHAPDAAFVLDTANVPGSGFVADELHAATLADSVPVALSQSAESEPHALDDPLRPAAPDIELETSPVAPVALVPVAGIEAQGEPATEVASRAVPVEVSGPHQDVVRAMHEADASALPVLETPPTPAAAAGETPLQIEREPAGADTSFALPRLPGRPATPAGPPVLRAPEPPRAPEAPAAPRIQPAAPPVLRVRATPDAPAAPPMLRVAVSGASADAPPMLRVSPSDAPPPAIVPTRPVSPIAAGAPAVAPGIGDASAAPAPVARTPWPALEPQRRRRLPQRTWVWVGVVAAVFAAGWLVGVITSPTRKGEPGPVSRLMRAVGLGPPHYVAAVNSTPTGAWIAVDGKDVGRRTPSDIELAPGAHTLTLSLPELGSTQVDVRGARNEKVAVTTSLNGGLEVYSSDASVPISVSLDGRDVGYAPVRLESVVPGLHELSFTGPGMPTWAQTVQVGVRRTMQVVAHPMSAPANGVVQVQATLNDERGATPLSGAQVWVDGQLKGVTPASFELPRGPHSLKLTWKGETAPVQVIDLPGGNERYASFNFGLDNPAPQVVLLGDVHPAGADDQVVVSARLTTLQVGDVRESWLHVSTPEGIWRRYPMTVMAGARGPVLACVFPPASLANGSARWYVSASTPQGDEYFSEMQAASVTGGGTGKPARRGAKN